MDARGGPLTNLMLKLAVAAGTLLLWCASAGLVFDPTAYLVVARGEIWNTNLFFVTWAAAACASYLVVDLLTANNLGEVVPPECALFTGNAIPRAWALLLAASVSLLAFKATLCAGPTCDGLLLEIITNNVIMYNSLKM